MMRRYCRNLTEPVGDQDENDSYPWEPAREWNDETESWEFLCIDRFGERHYWSDWAGINLAKGGASSRSTMMTIFLKCFPDELADTCKYHKKKPVPRLRHPYRSEFDQALLRRVELVNRTLEELRNANERLRIEAEELRQKLAEIDLPPARLLLFKNGKRVRTRRRRSAISYSTPTTNPPKAG